MSEILSRLLAFTRHGKDATHRLCIKCLDANLRWELASLSHAQDIEHLNDKTDNCVTP
ncbi:hypothetical protein HKCCE4037_01045 [Rhodobacterales bacterium HKCCE4037]|nr:hypothetical protein [Rhodobacterales bacterium HKCCE4037]